MNWWDDFEKRFEFGQILLWSGRIPDTGADMLYYFEKSWKWTTERIRWQDHGSPGPDDPTWDEFLDSLISVDREFLTIPNQVWSEERNRR